MSLLVILVMFSLGLFYGNILEWLIHRHLFHKIGLNKKSIFSYHVRGHHVLAKKNNFIDLTTSRVETFGLILLIAVHAPIAFISTPFFIGVFLYAILFRILHGVQHSNPEFCKKYFPWHWEHHMKKSSENYGVVAPWFDYIMKTRKKYK